MRRYVSIENCTAAQSVPVLHLPPMREKVGIRAVHGSSFPKVQLASDYQTCMRNMPPEHLRPQHLRSINALALDARPNSARLFSAGLDGLVCVWNLDQLDEPSQPRFDKRFRPHRSWIWDMKFIPSRGTILTCSSDCTIKAWNVDTAHTAHELGTHKNYVKALAPSHASDWVASGSLDHHLCLWDLREGRKAPMWQVQTPSSIYSVASNRSGSVIATGDLDGVVRGWDPRMRGSAFKLVGHEDLVRTMVMSPDGQRLLSGSSDTTVRLWSTNEQRCLHTYAHHSASVWKLHYDDNDLSTFYSGDRNGILCKVHIDPSNHLENDRCIVLAQECQDSTGRGAGITSIVAHNNKFVWTSNFVTSTFRCWPDTSNLNVDTRSQVNLHDPAMMQLFRPNAPAYKSQQAKLPFVVTDATPLFKEPVHQVFGFHGILRGAILNDRVHALTIDSGGVVALWNIFYGSCIGTFDVKALNAAAMSNGYPPSWQSQISPTNTIDLVQSIIEGDGTANSWCSLDTSDGRLTMTIDQSNLWASDMYLDELHELLGNRVITAWYEDRVILGVCVLRNLFKNMITAEMQMRQTNTDGQPMLLKWLNELNLSPNDLMLAPVSQLPNSPSPNAPSNLNFRLILAQITGSNSAKNKEVVSTSTPESPLMHKIVRFLYGMRAFRFAASAEAQSPPTSPLSESGTTFFNTFRRTASKWRLQNAPSSEKNEDNAQQSTYVNELSSLLAGPWREMSPLSGIPKIQFPDQTSIRISQVDRRSGSSTLVYRGTVGSVGTDAPLLELLAPMWLLSVVMSPEIVQKEAPLVKVVLQKWVANTTSQEPQLIHHLELAQLPTEVGTLTAPRNLRVGRVAEYVKQALLSNGVFVEDTGSNPADIPIDILCNGYLVPPRYTLAQCQTFCWKNVTPGMIRLRYRRRSNQIVL